MKGQLIYLPSSNEIGEVISHQVIPIQRISGVIKNHQEIEIDIRVVLIVLFPDKENSSYRISRCIMLNDSIKFISNPLDAPQINREDDN